GGTDDAGSVSRAHRLFSDDWRRTAKDTGTVTTRGSGSGSVDYSRQRDSEAETATDRFDLGGDSSYERVTGKDGKVSQTLGGQVRGSAHFDTTRRDGDSERHDVFDHKATLGGKATLADRKLTVADFSSDLSTSWKGTGASGPEADRRERDSAASGSLKTSRKGTGDDAVASATLAVDGRNEQVRTTT